MVPPKKLVPLTSSRAARCEGEMRVATVVICFEHYGSVLSSVAAWDGQVWLAAKLTAS